MATKRLTIDKYATLELNRVAFGINGGIIADLPLDAGFTSTAPAENGMLLGVDYAAGKVSLPTPTSPIIGLHCSPEKEYNPNLAGLKNFCLTAIGTGTHTTRNQTFYPRLGILTVGDRFTSNCISYDTAYAADDAALKTLIAAAGTTAVYGVPGADGSIQLKAALAGTEKVALQVVKATTIPNGGYGVKFVVIKA